MPNSGWDRGGSYLPSAVQAHAMNWVGQPRRVKGDLYRDEAAKVLGVTQRTLFRLEAAGHLRSYPARGGGGLRVFKEDEVLDLATERMLKRGLRAQKKAEAA